MGDYLIYFCAEERSKVIAFELLDQVEAIVGCQIPDSNSSIHSAAFSYSPSSTSLSSPRSSIRPYHYINLEPEISACVRRFNQRKQFMHPKHLDTPTQIVEYDTSSNSLARANHLQLSASYLNRRMNFDPPLSFSESALQYLLTLLLLLDLYPFIKYWIYGTFDTFSLQSLVAITLMITSPVYIFNTRFLKGIYQDLLNFSELDCDLENNSIYQYCFTLHLGLVSLQYVDVVYHWYIDHGLSIVGYWILIKSLYISFSFTRIYMARAESYSKQLTNLRKKSARFD